MSSISQSQRASYHQSGYSPTNNILLPDVAVKLGQRCRQWPNFTSTLGQCLVFVSVEGPATKYECEVSIMLNIPRNVQRAVNIFGIYWPRGQFNKYLDKIA